MGKSISIALELDLDIAAQFGRKMILYQTLKLILSHRRVNESCEIIYVVKDVNEMRDIYNGSITGLFSVAPLQTASHS